jgi:LacI family transcriptional regulator
MLMGVMSRLKGTRYAIYIVNWSTHPDEHRRLLSDISDQRFICGSIWLTPGLGPEDQKLAKHSSLPVVLAEGILPDTDSVTVDNALGGYLGARHLFKNHSRNLVLVTGAPSTPVQKDRLKGVQKAAAEAGVPFNSLRRIRADNYGFLDGARAAEELAALARGGKGPISVFCLAGDWCAMGILDGLKRAGIKVPSQVALMGYDGMLSAASTQPALSTIEQPLFELGAATAGALLERVENHKTPVKQLRLQPKLLLRETA